MQAIIRLCLGPALLTFCAMTVHAQETSLRPVARPTQTTTEQTPEIPATVSSQRPVARSDAAANRGVSEADLAKPVRPLAQALDLVRNGSWSAAASVAKQDGPIATDVIEWHRLRAGRGSATEVLLFLRKNPDWPGLPFLRKKSEPSFVKASSNEISAFFAVEAPQTAAGAFALATVQGPAEAQKTAVDAWTRFPMNSELQQRYMSLFADVLKPHHAARLDQMLWQGAKISARRMLPLVSDNDRAVAQSRLAYMERAGDVSAKLDAVPEALRSTPGLRHARFDWMMAKNQRDRAIALMKEASASAKALGEPDAWASRRRQLVREEMRAGRFAQAYALAAPNHMSKGTPYSDLEWLAGYMSLRLDEPARALEHFDNLDANVASPISKGRAGYWRGRAYEAMGDKVAAQAAYAEGAKFQTSFYGLLAAERGGIAPDPTLSGFEDFPPWRDAAFRQSSVFKAAILLLAADELTLAERFFTHLSEGLDRNGVGQLGDLLMALERPHIQVMVGKRAASKGMEVPGPYYALHPVAEMPHPVPTELVLAISRRESEFDPVVVSGAGARGLMQLMPGTASDVSRELGIPYVRNKLLSDYEYNARLGSQYLSGLAKRFDGNIVMMSAGYNAGPGRPLRWMERSGDPRKGGVDVIDWIEMIPFNETRNYVMRVAESLPVYRARLGRNPHPVPFSKELTGSTLLPLSR